MIGLTPKQAECLDAIRRLSTGGVAPNYEELRLAIGVGSRSMVCGLIDSLAERGAIVRIPGKARSIAIVERPDIRVIEALSDADLRQHIATCAGILAHRTGGGMADAVLNRIGARLAGRPLNAKPAGEARR